MSRIVRNMDRSGDRSGVLGIRRSGFTIVEMIVTIGILMVVTAGVATIFNSIGDTVSRGRKLSSLNQFAARVERVMRDDFDSMTRDGFLVIVNKNANFGRDAQLFRGEKTDIDKNLYPGFSDGGGRIRRADEIMFFTRGDYETARRAISPDMIARSHEAAIYYGLGQKRRPDLININGLNNFFFNPAPWDSNYDYAGGFNQAGVGVESTGVPNPNQFARDWSLLRQVTLLSTPLGESQNVPLELFGFRRDNALERGWIVDSDRQVGLQPVARSIFSSLGWTNPDRVSPGLASPTGPRKARWLGDQQINQLDLRENPQYRASGIVDIVSEDLASIRGMIQSLPVKVAPEDYSVFNQSGQFGNNQGKDRKLIDRDQFVNDYWGIASDTGVEPDPKDANELNLKTNALHRVNIRKWMIDALPSRWDQSNPNRLIELAGVRYEDIPTRIMFPDSQFENSDRGHLQRVYAEANQEMLGSSVFVPKCTEFVVEWSYGFIDNSITNPLDPNYKRMIWYGLDRSVDSNNDGVLDSTDQLAAGPYRQRGTAQAGTDPVTAKPRERGMDPQLIVGRMSMAPSARFNPDRVELATFGFMDPKGAGDANDGDVWLWPKFVRITMNLADPSDREVEQTYQVVFELPGIKQ